MQKMWVKGEIFFIQYPAIRTYQGRPEPERPPNKVTLLQLNLRPSFLFDHLKQGVNKYLV